MDRAPHLAERWYHAAAYDAVRDRMIVHGGYGNDGAPSWTLLTPAGTPPTARSYSVAGQTQ